MCEETRIGADLFRLPTNVVDWNDEKRRKRQQKKQEGKEEPRKEVSKVNRKKRKKTL